MAGGSMAAAGFERAALLTLLIAACATAPPPLTDLSGTKWRVVAVNGRAVPVQGDYSLNFDRGGRVGGRFGCNAMGGQFGVVGGTLTVRNLTQTLMGCPEPAATDEHDGAAVLGQPMQMSFTSNERLGLANAAGTITLDPIP